MKINEGASGDWKYYYLEEFHHLLAPMVAELPVLFAKHLKASTKLGDYRIQLNIAATPFLVAFIASKKTIRFYSPRMGAELFALKSTPPELVNTKFQDLKEHVDVAGQLLTHKTPTVSELVTNWNDLAVLTDEKYQAVFKKSEKLVQALLKGVHHYRPTLFERVSDYGLSLTAQFSLLRIHLLKFLAILPSLDHDQKGHEVKRMLLESLRRLLEDSAKASFKRKKGSERSLPSSFRTLFSVTHQLVKIFPAGALAIMVRFCVRMMAKRFIAGESIEKTDKSLKNIFKSRRDVTLDQLGELVVSEKEADHYCAQVLKLIQGFHQHIPRGEKNGAGILRSHVSIKVSALSSDFKPQAYEYTYASVAPRLKKILLTAKMEKVFINIDAEHYHYRDLVLKIYSQVLLETPELKDYADTGIVLQAYLRDGYEHLLDIIALAKKRQLIMPIRIVKGAYWDAETVEGDANNFDAPQFLNKEETDLHFNQLVVKIFENYPHIQICLASHNFTDHCFAETLRQEYFANLPAIEHQCLHMTYEALSLAMAEMGLVVRNYVPVGPLIVGMAYLVRRIMENSSQVGVLTIMRSHKRVGTLTPPWQIHQEQKSKGTIKRDLSVEDLSARFINITPVRLYVQSDLICLQNKFKAITNSLNKFYPNHFLQNGKRVSIHSSSDHSIKVGEILFAGKEDANKAIEIVSKDYYQGKWSKLSWFERAHCLNRAALLMLAQRLELSALISYEAGKTAHEALGDVDEAIDFLNFYAREEAKFYQRNSKSKDNEILSRGPFAVIAPWNFPLAIPCGMVAGALVAGNTVILKSAEQTPLIAQVLVDLLHQSGVPYEALIHLPGEGSEVGQVLVDSSDLAGFIFTGSKAVGEMIYQKASGRLYKNPMTEAMQPTRVITEMGGKNAIIVTANAELDETVSGIIYSAFGHAGQKCSACSRVVVSNKIKSKLIERLKQACSDLNVGRAYDFSTFVNPLIGAEDKTRVIENVKIAGREKNARVVIDRSTENLPGNCIGPVVIEVTKDLAYSHESFAQKELFAPVLHIVGFDSLEEAIDLFNATSYALTGGIFSQSQDDIDYLSSHLECGNLYINRGITGARVAIEPFGGFKLSGTGPKAGGKNYLPTLHFLKNSNLVFHAKNESGTDYQFPRCGVSKLSATRRQNKLSDAFLLIIKNFEVLFPGIYGEEKEVLAHFRKWMNDDFLEFKNGTHPNRKIPGQLSYNDHRLHSKSALVIGESDKPDITTLIKVASALLVGLGVTVASRNQNNYEWWSKVKTFLHNAGISKENFDVYFASEKVLMQAISDLEYTHVIFDSIDSKYFTEIKCMTKKITPHEAPKLMDFKKFLEEFIWFRSFAVNTMRHGAPLEIDVV